MCNHYHHEYYEKNNFFARSSFLVFKSPQNGKLKKFDRCRCGYYWWGLAGLTAAQAFAKKGKKVILLEAFYCGAGASGKSSGFITPNCELGLSGFISRYGMEDGKTMWKSIELGLEHIRTNIKQYNIDCDYSEQDSLNVANSPKALKALIEEHNYLAEFGYTSQYIKKEDMPALIGSKDYYGGVTYANTFGISGYKYCQAMKEVLTKQGVLIYEETPVLDFQEHVINTLHGTVKADYIVVCADRFTPTFNKLTQEVYHAQNFLLISQPLTNDEIRTLFPERNLMVWDTDLIYNFYRISGNRLLIGGGSFLNSYSEYETHNSTYMYRKLTHYLEKKFPQITLQFEQMWPGLIGISKDVSPLAGSDKDARSIYYIAGAAGLSIAAMLGNYSADHLIDGADQFKDHFSPYRSFPIHGALQSVLGNKLSFALSNIINSNIP
jgi:gamma-glutamylputrescine oxidase